MAHSVAGGLDSTTVATLARREGYDLAAVTVDYGQTHQREIAAARASATPLGLHRRKAR
jgi:7-cyano-7-deazaguanine synthase